MSTINGIFSLSPSLDVGTRGGVFMHVDTGSKDPIGVSGYWLTPLSIRSSCRMEVHTSSFKIQMTRETNYTFFSEHKSRFEITFSIAKKQMNVTRPCSL